MCAIETTSNLASVCIVLLCIDDVFDVLIIDVIHEWRCNDDYVDKNCSKELVHWQHIKYCALSDCDSDS